MTFPRQVAVALVLSFSSIVFAQDAKTNDAVVAAPRDAKWLRRHESINSGVKEGPVDLVFIGDSITQGWESDGKKVWEEFYSTRQAANLGISGDRTQHVLWRLHNGNIEGIRPKLAVLMIGTNNSGTNSPDQIAAGVKTIVEVLQQKTPNTKILILAIFPRGADANDIRRKVNQGANAIIAKLADDKKVFYLDIGDKFLNPDGSLSKEIMPDLLHLNEKSYRIWAEAIEPQVAKFLSESKS